MPDQIIAGRFRLLARAGAGGMGLVYRALDEETGDTVAVAWRTPQRRIAPGQSVVFYDPTDTRVLGGGIAVRATTVRLGPPTA